MAIRSDGKRTEKRILTTCVRLFLEQGYHKTTMQQICREAEISPSSFFNLFPSKDSVVLELVKFMYENQFSIARGATGVQLAPVYIYAMETSIQLTLTELNENLREIYLEAYTQQHLMDYIQQTTAKELYQIFGCYQPGLTAQDFVELEYGTGGLMRGFMANPCAGQFTLERKLNKFLTLALRGYNVPEDEVERVLAFIAGQNVRGIAQTVMEELFRQLAMRYEFSLEAILPGQQ